MHSVYIGTSGWNYKHWRGNFYPAKLPIRRQLEYYAGQFNTVEVNSSFYGLPQPQTSQNWHQITPRNFVFAWKASRYITHLKRLKRDQQALRRMAESYAGLGRKLGVVLFQLPPQFQYNIPRLKRFFTQLPIYRQIDYVCEFRHASWFNDTTIHLLNDFDIGFCISDIANGPTPAWSTDTLSYWRLHGPRGKYFGHYNVDYLRTVAAEIQHQRKSRPVYIYFDNDVDCAAPFDALQLKQMIK